MITLIIIIIVILLVVYLIYDDFKCKKLTVQLAYEIYERLKNGEEVPTVIFRDQYKEERIVSSLPGVITTPCRNGYFATFKYKP